MKKSSNNGIAQIAGLAIIVMVLLLAGAVWSQDSSYMDDYIGGDASMIGDTKCLMCHRDKAPGEDATHVAALSKEDSTVVGFACEACHGGGSAHNGKVEGILLPTKMAQADVTDVCTQCHEEQGKFKLAEWKESAHMGAGNTCVTCHSGHSASDGFLVKDTAKALCGTCHADQVEAAAAGTHGAGADMSCAMCHNPHK